LAELVAREIDVLGARGVKSAKRVAGGREMTCGDLVIFHDQAIDGFEHQTLNAVTDFVAGDQAIVRLGDVDCFVGCENVTVCDLEIASLDPQCGAVLARGMQSLRSKAQRNSTGRGVFVCGTYFKKS
jgi:hypothetical protein